MVNHGVVAISRFVLLLHILSRCDELNCDCRLIYQTYILIIPKHPRVELQKILLLDKL